MHWCTKDLQWLATSILPIIPIHSCHFTLVVCEIVSWMNLYKWHVIIKMRAK